jgi:hypothetical protein
MISALFYGKGGFDHVLFMVNKTLPRPVIPVRRAWEFISRSFGNGIRLDRQIAIRGRQDILKSAILKKVERLTQRLLARPAALGEHQSPLVGGTPK